jgi:hypothetical protein
LIRFVRGAQRREWRVLVGFSVHICLDPDGKPASEEWRQFWAGVTAHKGYAKLVNGLADPPFSLPGISRNSLIADVFFLILGYTDD